MQKILQVTIDERGRVVGMKGASYVNEGGCDISDWKGDRFTGGISSRLVKGGGSLQRGTCGERVGGYRE